MFLERATGPTSPAVKKINLAILIFGVFYEMIVTYLFEHGS